MGSLPRRLQLTLIGALALVLVLVLGALAVYHSRGVSHVDASAYWAFYGIGVTHTRLAFAALYLLDSCNPGPYAVLLGLAALLALVRGRVSVAVAIVLMAVGATETSELLKAVLGSPRPPSGLPRPNFSDGSWPSGHTTAAMALAMSWVLAVPVSFRRVVAALGALYASTAAYCVLMLGWHYPSDALAGMVMALIWALLAVVGVAAVDARFGRRPLDVEPLRLGRPVAMCLAAAGTLPVVLLAVFRSTSVIDYAAQHSAMVVMGVALACLTAVCMTSVQAAMTTRGTGRVATAALRSRSRRG